MNAYGLKSETVVVCGQEFVVTQANVVASARRDIMISEIAQASDPAVEGEPIAMMALHYIKTLVYPSMICCTTSRGEPLPTLEEFLAMPGAEQQKWEEVVKKLNPHFFPAATEKEEEKKE